MDNEKDIAYLIVMFEIHGDSAHTADIETIKNTPLPSLEPIGVYTDLETALEYVVNLEDLVSDKGIVFDVFEFQVNGKPLMLELLEERQKDIQQAISESIIDLMKSGMVDQLIGEDGNFYYTLTELGKKTQELMPEQLKKFFKKRGK